jgi:hypothetical protein
MVGSGVQLRPLGTAATNRPIVPAPGDYDDGEIGGIIGRGNRSPRRKPAQVRLCPPQTPHAGRTRTWAAAVGSQRLTAWATARPWGNVCIDPYFLDLGTSWRWVVSFTSRPLYPRGKAPGTHSIGSWVDPRAGVDDVEKRKFLTRPGLEFQPLGRPARSYSLYRLRYPGSMTIIMTLKNRTMRK